MKKIYNLFKLKENKTSLKTEILAGISNFMSIAYVIFLIPSMIVNTSANNEMYNAIFIATCLTAFLGTLLMGLFANWPITQAPGLDLLVSLPLL